MSEILSTNWLVKRSLSGSSGAKLFYVRLNKRFPWPEANLTYWSFLLRWSWLNKRIMRKHLYITALSESKSSRCVNRIYSDNIKLWDVLALHCSDKEPWILWAAPADMYIICTKEGHSLVELLMKKWAEEIIRRMRCSLAKRNTCQSRFKSYQVLTPREREFQPLQSAKTRVISIQQPSQTPVPQ